DPRNVDGSAWATTTIGPIRAPATSRSGSVTSVAVEVPVTPMTWTDRPAPPPSPARSITSGEMTVRSAPVSTIKVSATPLRRASRVAWRPPGDLPDYLFRSERGDRLGRVAALGQDFVGVLALKRGGPADARAHP